MPSASDVPHPLQLESDDSSFMAVSREQCNSKLQIKNTTTYGTEKPQGFFFLNSVPKEGALLIQFFKLPVF